MEKTTTEEILGQETSRDLEILKKFYLLKDFYLAGGTGLALQLGHRRSYDLDFFTSKSFREMVFIKKISALGHFELDKKEAGTAIGTFRKTRVSFFRYPFSLLKKPKTILGLKVADLIDIACMKIDAVATRGSKKDFIDLYMIIQNGYTLKGLLQNFQKKYTGVKFNMVHIQKGLAFFEDAEKEALPIMLKPISWEQIKQFFLKEVKSL